MKTKCTLALIFGKRSHGLRIKLIVFATVINQTMSVINAQNTKGFAPVNGLQLYYEIYGTGDIPLVLIHGGGSTIETTFGNILPMLARHGKVIALELQALGRTSDRESASSFEQDADDVVGLLKYLNINKANFFGFSNGGNAAMQIGIRHPGVVNKLIIASSFYRRDGLIPGLFEGLQKATLENMPAPLKNAYLKVAPEKDHLQVMFDKDRDRMLHFKDWTDDDIRSINVPTMLIIGDHDIVTPEHAFKMSQLMPNTRLMIMPGTHGSYIGEVCEVESRSKIPELTTKVIEEFLDSH